MVFSTKISTEIETYRIVVNGIVIRSFLMIRKLHRRIEIDIDVFYVSNPSWDFFPYHQKFLCDKRVLIKFTLLNSYKHSIPQKYV